MLVYILKDDGSFDFEYQCPVDVMEPGKFLLPAIPYTNKKPPEAGINEVAVFIDNKWLIKADFRGLEYWKDNARYVIETIGELPPAILPAILPAEPVEIVVSPWQFRQALNTLNLRESVESFVGTTNNQDIKDGWEFATSWREFHPFVQSMGEGLGLTKEQIHTVFSVAATKG